MLKLRNAALVVLMAFAAAGAHAAGRGPSTAEAASTRLNAATPLSVTIDGPYAISTAGEYTWTANASGGDGPYSYRWFIEWNTSAGQLEEHGTDQTAVLWVDENTPTFFILYAEVTSGTQVQTAQIGVCNLTATAIC